VAETRTYPEPGPAKGPAKKGGRTSSGAGRGPALGGPDRPNPGASGLTPEKAQRAPPWEVPESQHIRNQNMVSANSAAGGFAFGFMT